MQNLFSRTERLIGKENIQKLQHTHVAIFGLGGVGGYALEALARSGIGHFTLVDHDIFSTSNLNRQILATEASLGQPKVLIAKERVQLINPDAEVEVRDCFFLPENAEEFDFSNYDFVVDAIDTVSGKIALILHSQQAGAKIISCMGCGNRFDPTKLRLGDIYETEMDPLAKIMRHELRKRHIRHCDVVFSMEKPTKPSEPIEENEKRSVPGSTAFVPSTAGLLIAYWVFEQITGVKAPTF